MPNIFRRLIGVLAGASCAELRQQVQFLKAENEILRSRLGRIRTSPAERARLVKLGKPLGQAVGELLSIVSYDTFRSWVRASRKRPAPAKRRKRGRPATNAQIRRLVLRLAGRTDWGVTRIHGEMKKLGIKISRTTVGEILRAAHMPPGPDRSESPWHELIRRHAKTLWACDFLSARVWTRRGLVDAFVLVFIHPKTRRIIVSPATTNPDAVWVTEQASMFAAAKTTSRTAILIRDGDGKFGSEFDAVLRTHRIAPLRLPFSSPNLNAYAERVVRTIKGECLDRFVILGMRHLDYLLSEYADYYNRQRPHSRIGSRAPTGPPVPLPSDTPLVLSEIRCRERLGGVVKHFYRAAA